MTAVAGFSASFVLFIRVEIWRFDDLVAEIHFYLGRFWSNDICHTLTNLFILETLWSYFDSKCPAGLGEDSLLGKPQEKHFWKYRHSCCDIDRVAVSSATAPEEASCRGEAWLLCPSILFCLLKLLGEAYPALRSKTLFSKVQLQGDNSCIPVHFPRQALSDNIIPSQQCRNSFEAGEHRCLTPETLLWLVLMFNAVGQR